MKLSLLSLLPIFSTAFTPVNVSPKINPLRASHTIIRNQVDDACEKVVSTTETYVGKADNLVISRVMRLVDHAPMFVTLKALADKAGMSASLSGIAASPESFTGLATALAVPTWCFNVWAIIALSQAASIAKSALASDENELSQGDITAATATNFVAARAIGSATPLKDTILAALVSGYALRSGNSSGSATIHNAAIQLTASFTTVLSVLGVVSAIAPKIPFIGSCSSSTTLLGVASLYAMATRSGNGTVKKAVNAGVLGGMLFSALSGGISISASVSSLLSNVGLVGLGYVTYGAVKSLKEAVLD